MGNYTVKSILVARLPRKGDNEFKTAIIKLFEVNDPHKTSELPTEELEYDNIERVEIKGKTVDYFLEGNDIIINDVGNITIEQQNTTIVIS